MKSPRFSGPILLLVWGVSTFISVEVLLWVVPWLYGFVTRVLDRHPIWIALTCFTLLSAWFGRNLIRMQVKEYLRKRRLKKITGRRHR
ncbi:MAG: hypothetical protein KGJ34_02335 [Patescibacteria group bacterium]|nr:hypothetical protein [Patescibacteria group bacterium]